MVVRKNSNKSFMKNFCYTPIKGIDDVIAERINSIVEGSNWTPYRVATLRGIYCLIINSEVSS